MTTNREKTFVGPIGHIVEMGTFPEHCRFIGCTDKCHSSTSDAKITPTHRPDLAPYYYCREHCDSIVEAFRRHNGDSSVRIV